MKLINPFNGADDFEIMFIVPSEVENDKHKKAESQRLRENWASLCPKASSCGKIRTVNNKWPGQKFNREVLNLKTTRIDSTIREGVIRTTLTDRGVKIYETEELDKFNLLRDVSISLFT